MKPPKGQDYEKPEKSETLTVDIDAKVLGQVKVMHAFTKIPMEVLVNTALKRYIATHKDYFPHEKLHL